MSPSSTSLPVRSVALLAGVGAVGLVHLVAIAAGRRGLRAASKAAIAPMAAAAVLAARPSARADATTVRAPRTVDSAVADDNPTSGIAGHDVPAAPTAPTPTARTTTALFTAGLGAAWIGDLALLGDSPLAFGGGLGAFLVAQGCWVGAMRSVPGPGLVGAYPLAAAPYALAWTGLVATVALGRKAGPFLGPVAGYGAALCGMATTALDLTMRVPRRPGTMMALGAAAFVVSDATIALREFGPLPRSRGTDLVVMSTYVTALGLMSAAAASLTAHPPAQRGATPVLGGARQRSDNPSAHLAKPAANVPSATSHTNNPT